MSLLEALETSPPFLVASVFLLGLVIGSFLNVVIYRLPRRLEQQWKRDCAEMLGSPEAAPEPLVSLVHPGSRCPSCAKPIRWQHNLPVLSWLWLRGRCANCKVAISMQYPLVELATGLASALLAFRFGFGAELLVSLPFTWSLVALCGIDLKHQLLPDVITLPLLWSGLLLSVTGLFTDPVSSIIGAAGGYLALWLVFHAFRLLTGKEGMGFGDFKLLAALGAWFGWQMLPQILLVASLVGTLVGLTLILSRRLAQGVPIAFGPYLAAAGWIALLAGDEINSRYLLFTGLS